MDKSLLAQNCPPSPELRSDLHRFISKQDNLEIINEFEKLFSSQFAKVIRDKSFFIDRFDGLVDIFLDDEEIVSYHKFISVWFSMQFLPRIIEDFNTGNQGILGRYIDFLLSADGVGIDFISSSLPLLEGHWSAERIESAALKAYQSGQDILDRHDSGEDIFYPPPRGISKNDQPQLRLCEISLLKSALDSLAVMRGGSGCLDRFSRNLRCSVATLFRYNQPDETHVKTHTQNP